MTPDSSSAQRGLILIQQGRYRDAEKYLRESLASDPNNPATLYYLALCELNQSKPADARTTIEQALALAPEVDGFHALRPYASFRWARSTTPWPLPTKP